MNRTVRLRKKPVSNTFMISQVPFKTNSGAISVARMGELA
jgi:hypothetical protein